MGSETRVETGTGDGIKQHISPLRRIDRSKRLIITLIYNLT